MVSIYYKLCWGEVMAINKLKQMRYIQDEFTVATLLLGITGLLINLALSKLVIALDLPLYLDNVGSVLVAILGGPLLGMTVGFLSNVVGSISTPISMYYGIITILIAWGAALFARRGLLGQVRGWLLLTVIFAVLGGLGGGLLTWFLYGQNLSGLAAE